MIISNRLRLIAWEDGDLTEKRESDGLTELRRRWLIRAVTGQRTENGIMGRGIERARWKNWIVLVARMCKNALLGETCKSKRRGTLGEVTSEVGSTILDLRRNKKTVTRKKAHIAAWRGLPMSNNRAIRKSREGVIGSLRAGISLRNRLHPRTASWKTYELSHQGEGGWVTKQTMKVLYTVNMILYSTVRPARGGKKGKITKHRCRFAWKLRDPDHRRTV